jgi:hypothetical protein
MQLDKPAECTSEGNPLSFIKFCIYCFSLWYEFYVHYTLRAKKNYQHGLDAQPLEFQFLRLRGCLTNPFRTLSLCFGVTGKTPGLISCFVKKNFCLFSYRNNVLARCNSIFPLFRCQGVWNKMCIQLSLSQILFQNLKIYSLGDVQRFCYHSWCNSTVIFDQIGISRNVYLSLSWIQMATSRHLLPAPFCLEIEDTT